MSLDLEKALMDGYRENLIAIRESTIYKEKSGLLIQQMKEIKIRIEKQKNEEILLKDIIKENLHDRNVLKNIYKSMDIQIDYLRKNIDELTKEIEKDGLILKGNTRDIWDASAKGCLTALKFYILENPKNINKKNTNFYNWTPLHYAANKGRLNCLKFLFFKGAEIEALSTTHSTPLMQASAHGHIDAINFLLDRRANINHKNTDKRTALHLAGFNNHKVAFKLLIRRGADKNKKDINGKIPYMEFNHS